MVELQQHQRKSQFLLLHLLKHLLNANVFSYDHDLTVQLSAVVKKCFLLFAKLREEKILITEHLPKKDSCLHCDYYFQNNLFTSFVMQLELNC